MNQESNSDSEFWDTLSEIPSLSQRSNSKNIPIVPEPNIKLKKISLEANQWDYEKQEKIMDRLKYYTIEKVRELGIKVKNQTKRELFETVKEIVAGFQSNILEINENNYKMKENYVSINRTIMQLIQKLANQNKVIDSHAIKDSEFQSSLEPTEENLIQQEIKTLAPQAYCLREVAAEVNKDHIQANEKVQKANQELNSIIKLHNTQLENVKNHYETKENLINQEIEEIKQEYDQYKFKAEQELLIRDIIYKRQKEFINKLYDELGNTKFIFNNPRLRHQLQAKAKTIDFEANSVVRSSYTIKRPRIQTRATKYSENEDLSIWNSRPVTRDLRSCTPYK
jgi:hypothetical protein